ncbi:heterokaryon incompatibility protein-domain-containing protein [Stachybotrys elegans]|uniref:Heterokaryon incompatibility protein-domain-containing protein n=1 Tax=Stachybotrys elegans TaxID=80388 RepID=A0A8K0SXF2_9HYPO|nr:heterokaryon incompatibility protein-domain-containing protein [Stachybotrys elegans]
MLLQRASKLSLGLISTSSVPLPSRRFLFRHLAPADPRPQRAATSAQLLAARTPPAMSLSSVSAGGRRPYEYTSLTHHGAIRILTLEAGEEGDPLVGDLSVEDIDGAAAYEAISYAWGSHERCAEMTLSGGEAVLPLTQSIHDALVRMRDRSRTRRLWADQICINQADIAERSHQVSLMNALYKNAERILVWLGKDEQGVAHRAMRMVHYLHGVFEDEMLHEAFRTAHSEKLDEQSQEPWMPLSTLTKLPWFNRIWIVQEIGTSAPATLFWGEAHIEWDELSTVAGILNQSYHLMRSMFHIYTPNIRYLHRRFVEPEGDYDENHNRGSFIYELHRARHLASKDPRDHVYAFLGHFSLRVGSRFLAGLTADYSRSVEDVYVDVAVRELKGARSLLLLSACHPGQNNNPRNLRLDDPAAQSLPTWVPDWRLLPLHIMGSPESRHRAAGASLPRLTIDEAARVLRIDGVRIDTVERASHPFHNFSFQYNANPKRALPFEAVWHRVCGHRAFSLEPRYVTGESAFSAMVHTLTNAGIGGDRSSGYRVMSAEEWTANGAAYLVRMRPEGRRVSSDLVELALQGNPFKWTHEATLVTRYRCFAVTEGGYYVMGPSTMRQGDVIAVLFGGKTPFVLRKVEESGAWILLGECYVHGMMNGEALAREDATEETFDIR